MNARSAGVLDAIAYLGEERMAVETALARVVERAWPDPGDPVGGAARYALEGGGKRLRPIACVAAFRAASAAPADPAIYDMAVALELIHTYSLVHDDLPCMDDDALRRGRPTAHRVYGSRVAVLAGAAMIGVAFRALDDGAAALGLGGSARAELASVLARAAGAAGMVGGQVLDLEAEGRALDGAALEAIHRRKTGALFAGAARLGGIAARAPEETASALEAYGAALGHAFQIADDILDEVGASDVLGKDAGRDRALHKATYPALLGLEGAKQRAREAARDAAAALARAGLEDAALLALARFAVERDR